MEKKHELIPLYFMEAQKSKAAHRKLFHALRKLHCEAIQSRKELEFNRPFISCLNRVLVAKQKALTVERIMDFIPGYIFFLKEKDREEALKTPSILPETPGSERRTSGIEANEDVEDSFLSNQFAIFLLKYLVKGISVKDKNVRYRCSRLIFQVSSSMSSIDESLFALLKTEILSRARDKEPLVRKEIVGAMSILQTAEGDEDTNSIWNALADLLQYDPSPLVRRAALVSVPVNTQTLPSVLSRCSDEDPTVRKMAFKVLAANYPNLEDLPSSFCGPLLNQGLHDTESDVREACAELIDTWIAGAPLDLIRLLVKLNVVASLEISEALVLMILERDPSFVEKVHVNDDFWKNLTPETALLLRCMVQKTPAVADAMVVETLAYYLQSHTNRMLLNQDERLDTAFQLIVHELLKLASFLDYADELGRRQMFSLIRSMVTSVDISEELMDPLMALFRMICIDERDYIRVIQDVVRDIQDEAMEDDEADAQIFRDLKCLFIVQHTLASSAVGWRHDSFTPMHGLLPELILPAFQRHAEYGIIVASAVGCLGLICLSSREHAQQYLSQIIAYAGAPCAMNHDLVDVVLASSKVLFDLIHVYGMERLNAPTERLKEVFLHGLSCPVRSVAALYVEGCTKLFLIRRLTDLEVIKTLVVMALSPDPCLPGCFEYLLNLFPNKESKDLLAPIYAKLVLALGERNPAQLVPVSQRMATWLDDAAPGRWQVPAAIELIEFNFERDSLKQFLQVCARFSFAHADAASIDELRSWIGQIHSQEPGVQNTLRRINRQLVLVAPTRPSSAASPPAAATTSAPEPVPTTPAPPGGGPTRRRSLRLSRTPRRGSSSAFPAPSPQPSASPHPAPLDSPTRARGRQSITTRARPGLLNRKRTATPPLRGQKMIAVEIRRPRRPSTPLLPAARALEVVPSTPLSGTHPRATPEKRPASTLSASSSDSEASEEPVLPRRSTRQSARPVLRVEDLERKVEQLLEEESSEDSSS